MNWFKTRRTELKVLAAALAVAGAFVGVRSLVYAEGVPDMNTLVYTGRLVEDGVPVNGTHDIRVTLWSHPDSTDIAAHRLCRVVPATDVLVQDGYFRIPLDLDDNSCEVAIADHSEVWYEVMVDGMLLMPRTQVAAVPYALEANRASGAAGDLRRELDELVPAGTIISYAGEANSTTAPPGWILCDGRPLNGALGSPHARLFTAIGTAWGNGSRNADGTADTDTMTNFNLPDLRGRFLRGVDQGALHDRGATARTTAIPMGGGNAADLVGTFEVDSTALPTIPFGTSTNGNHAHSYSRADRGPTGNGGSYFYLTGGEVGAGTGAAGDHQHSVGGGGDPETRPENLSVNYLIRL